MEALIQSLVEAWGPSGYEHHVRALIENEVKDLCDEMTVDSLGNLICRIGEKTDDNLRIMIAAHMDEIGLMVSHVDRNGYLRFTNIGGLMPLGLMGNRVKFEDGTIGTISTHNGWAQSTSQIPSMDDFYIDVSTDADEEGKQMTSIKPGDPGAFWRTMEKRGHRLISKSMDDRIGCAVAIETMRLIKESGTPHEVVFVFTVQEEVGVRGARTSAFIVNPDLGIALDVTVSADMPKADLSSVVLGKGAAIKVKDKMHLVPLPVRDLMIDVAEANNIPYQLEILTAGSTDAAAIQLTREGVPSGVISIPCRYVHSVSETVDIRDVQASVDLLAGILQKPGINVRPQ